MKLKGGETPQSAEMIAARSPDWELNYRDINITKREDRTYLAGTVGMGQSQAERWWQWYEKIGEVRYALNRSARIAGYARFYAERVDNKGVVTRTNAQSPTVNKIMAGITSRFGGVRGLVQRYYVLMKVPGEAFFIQFRADMPDGYWFMSPDEIVNDSLNTDTKTLTEPITWRTARLGANNDGSSDAFTLKVQPEDFYGRVWNPSYRYVDECDSPMAAVAPLCEMLDDLTNSIRSRIRSRFASNGMLLIPSGINSAGIAGARPNAGLYSDNAVLNAIIHIMTVNMARTGNAVDRLPIALMGDADELDKVRHMVFDNDVDEVDLKLRVELIGRILDGLDQQKAATKDGEGQSHWGAWATEEAERRVTVEPDLQQLDHILTRMVLWRELKKLDWSDADITSWRVRHELDDAAVRINQAEDWRQLWDRGELSGDALRTASGADALDKPGDDERVRMLGYKIGDAYLANYGLTGIEIDYTKVGLSGKKSGPNADNAGDPAPVGPGSGDPGAPDNRDSDAPKNQEPR